MNAVPPRSPRPLVAPRPLTAVPPRGADSRSQAREAAPRPAAKGIARRLPLAWQRALAEWLDQGDRSSRPPSPRPVAPAATAATPPPTRPRPGQPPAPPPTSPPPQPVPVVRHRGRPAPQRPGPSANLPTAVPSPPASQERRSRPAPPSRWRSIAVQIGRTLVVSIGLGAIVGTGLVALDPSLREPAASLGSKPGAQIDRASQAASQQLNTQLPPPSLVLRREIPALQQQVQQIALKWPKLKAHVAIVDLDTGDYAVWNDRQPVAAASTIKVPIAYAFFQDVDAGKLRLDELLTLDRKEIVGEAGDMQYRPPGSQFTALATITKTLAISDNTATNLAITRLGGTAGLNDRFKAWGLSQTVLKTFLPDLGATNLTSARDLATMMAAIHRGEGLSMRSRDRLLGIMRKTSAQSLLPKGLGAGADIAHKTGTLGGLLADAGLVDTPNGRRYAAIALVNRPREDKDAAESIRALSKVAYNYFASQPPIAR